jgi:glycerophosphoryl diester phosphodiesterase
MAISGAIRVGLVLLSIWALQAQAFDLQSHRGGRGLRPENTLASFENAIRLGTTTLEMDIAITADGVPVISHDPALNPAFTRDAQGHWLAQNAPLIKSLTLAQLKTYDVGRLNPSLKYGRDFPEQQPRDGERIPTLAEVFKLARDMGANDIHFDMETKIDPHRLDDTLSPEAFVDVVLKAIRDAGMTKRVMVQSFDWRTLELLHKLEPDLRTMYLTMDFPNNSTITDAAWTAGHRIEDFGGSVPRLVRASAGTAKGIIWAPNSNNLNAALLKEAHALDLQVIPWTVNDKPQMERLIDWGVDGLITDYPNRLREVMAAKGIPLPKGVNP